MTQPVLPPLTTVAPCQAHRHHTDLTRLTEGERLRLRAERMLRDIGWRNLHRMRRRYEVRWLMNDLDWQALLILPIAFTTAGVIDAIGARLYDIPVTCSQEVDELQLLIAGPA